MRNQYAPFPFLDFFAGSGLVDEGLKPWFRTAWANDICPKKAKVFLANQPAHVFHPGSIEHVKGETLPFAVLSWGSFPCQDLSLAGNMHGITAHRSGLVWEWIRVMDEIPQKPPVVVAENVVGLVSAEKGAHFQNLFKALNDRGYICGAVVLDASYWTPQSRKRVFLIGVSRDIPLEDYTQNLPSWPHPEALVRAAGLLEGHVWWKLPKPAKSSVTIDDIFDSELPTDSPEKTERLLDLVPENHRRRMELDAKNGKRFFTGYKRVRNGKQVLEIRFDGVAGCLRTPSGGSSRQFVLFYSDGQWKTRLLAVKEAAMLMGAPEDYVIPGSYNDGYKAMGDGVAVPVSRYLARNLLAPLAQRAACKVNEFQKGA